MISQISWSVMILIPPRVLNTCIVNLRLARRKKQFDQTVLFGHFHYTVQTTFSSTVLFPATLHALHVCVLYLLTLPRLTSKSFHAHVTHITAKNPTNPRMYHSHAVLAFCDYFPVESGAVVLPPFSHCKTCLGLHAHAIRIWSLCVIVPSSPSCRSINRSTRNYNTRDIDNARVAPCLAFQVLPKQEILIIHSKHPKCPCLLVLATKHPAIYNSRKLCISA